LGARAGARLDTSSDGEPPKSHRPGRLPSQKEEHMKKWLGLVVATVALCFVASPAFATTTIHVYRAHTPKYTYSTGATISIWSYVTPKFSSLSNKKIYYYVYKKNSSGSYVYKKRVRGTLYKSASYSYSTRSKASTTISTTGYYRIRVRFMWKSSGTWHSKWSYSHYIHVTA
jgi:hypothetical protein